MGLIIILTCWIIGLCIALLLNKYATSLWAKKEGILDKGTQETDLFDIKNTKKHFLATFAMNCSALLIATYFPFIFFKWIFFIGCGMLLAPIFYNALYVCLPQAIKSKLRFTLTITSFINLVLIAYTLIYIYFGYLNVEFV